MMKDLCNSILVLIICILSANLISCNGGSSSDAETVPITVNSLPIANAGADRTVTTGIMVTMDGTSSSDADVGDTLSYRWSFVSLPSGSTVSLSDATVPNPSFTPDKDGDYVLSLVVSDGEEDSTADHVVITALFVTLPQTGQSFCYDTSFPRLPVPCSGTGQDGESKAGVTWPIPRFTELTPEITRDELTGLEWTKDRNAPGPAECLPNATKIWDDALGYVKCLNRNSYLGYNDWRLPNVVELSSLFNAAIDASFSERFLQGSWVYWWTSTTRLNNPSIAYRSLAEGCYISSSAKTDFAKVWPVRSGSAGFVFLHQTGQVECFDSAGVSIDCGDTGQDGEILAGQQWPDPRFTDIGDGTMIDNLTGIYWTKNTEYPYSEVCSPGTTDFSSTVGYITCLNDNKYLGYDDWRLPNEIEVRSIRNYGVASSQNADWLSSYGFHNFSSVYVLTWSSTIEDTFTPPVGVWVGGGHWDFDFDFGHAWPVRGGVNP
jgi:hypothetical protein